METNEYFRLLHNLWAQTGLPVWEAALQPGIHQPPYLTWSAARPAFGGAAQMEADAWFGGVTAAAQREAFLQALERVLPPQGVQLTGRDGVILIHRSEKDFVTTEATRAAVIHVQVRATVRLYG